MGWRMRPFAPVADRGWAEELWAAALPPAWPPLVWPPPGPQPPPPAPPSPQPPFAQTFQALDHLAYRVAYNREVAGVHYPMDSDAGRFVALSCIFKLNAAAGAVPLFQALVAAAAAELVNLP